VANSNAIRDSTAAIAITATMDVAAAINAGADSVAEAVAAGSSSNSRADRVGIRDSAHHSPP